jgi:hypothetical protein
LLSEQLLRRKRACRSEASNQGKFTIPTNLGWPTVRSALREARAMQI